MVNTGSQNVDSYEACSSGIEQNSDNESEYSFPNTLSRNQMNEFENGDLINVRQNSNLSSVDQRFMEMNRQISDLPSIVLALTEKISSSTTECSGLNTVTNTNVTRSDSGRHFPTLTTFLCRFSELGEDGVSPVKPPPFSFSIIFSSGFVSFVATTRKAKYTSNFFRRPEYTQVSVKNKRKCYF